MANGVSRRRESQTDDQSMGARMRYRTLRAKTLTATMRMGRATLHQRSHLGGASSITSSVVKPALSG